MQKIILCNCKFLKWFAFSFAGNLFRQRKELELLTQKSDSFRKIRFLPPIPTFGPVIVLRNVFFNKTTNWINFVSFSPSFNRQISTLNHNSMKKMFSFKTWSKIIQKKHNNSRNILSCKTLLILIFYMCHHFTCILLKLAWIHLFLTI